MFLDHYSLVVKILFPGRSVDGSRHQRKTWERGDSLGSRLTSAEAAVKAAGMGYQALPADDATSHMSSPQT